LQDKAEADDEADKPALPEGKGEEPDNDTSDNGSQGGQGGEKSQAPAAAFGMTLAVLDDERRKSFGINESVEGVVITKVDAGSVAATKGLKEGEVVVEVAQDFVENPADLVARVEALKGEGRRNAHLMIADKAGNLRFVALPLE
jgi:serine protease Do